MLKRVGGFLLMSGLVAGGTLSGCNADSSGGSGDGSSGESGNNGSGGSNTGVDYDACFSCGNQACPSQASSCDSATGCRGLLDCIFACDQGDANCQLGCAPSDGNSPEAAAAASFYSCAIVQCTQQCVPQVQTPTSSGAGGGSSTTSASGSSTSGVTATSGTGGGGSSSTNTASNTSSNPSTSSDTSTTSTTGGTTTLQSGINWLTFDGNWADPEAGVNGDLNISGVLYTYDDGCATVNWDPTTRCVSGTLCDPGADYANWGMAVGFDFHNTGEDGTPPETKFAWSASSVGAQGVAWQVSGYAPGLQVWITNMDSSWAGECAADDCTIDGPPDGTTYTSLGAPDQMSFSSMVKDDWGGSGTAYTFDPDQVLAMQFKLASVVSGAVSYDFCIDQIGIVR